MAYLLADTRFAVRVTSMYILSYSVPRAQRASVNITIVRRYARSLVGRTLLLQTEELLVDELP